MLEAENESLRQQNTMLDAKLAEIEAALIATERQVEILSHLLSMRRREAAQPAQELLTCSVCGVDTQDPWHYSDGSSHERALYLFGK